LKDWEEILLSPDAPLREALLRIDRAGSQMALVVDSERILLGTLSDGDIRRALLRGADLSFPVGKAMHRKPTTIPSGSLRDEALAVMRREGLHQVPVVDGQNRVVGLEVVGDFLLPSYRENWVVVMAGGTGSRLKDLTTSKPKPMLEVGGRPLLETLLESFVSQGFRRFYFAVNHLADVIEEYFGAGEKWKIDIRYLREEQRMGTAGALSLLPDRPDSPFIVTNADLLVKLDYQEMLDRHIDEQASATMAVREYEFQIPFGVVIEAENLIRTIDEKPIHRSLVCAGIYVLAPETLDFVPKSFTDMPELFEKLIASGQPTRCHRVDGYWLDIGRPPDYARAKLEFRDVFG
jgi:dTDP-glucose pyrophosphorylase